LFVGDHFADGQANRFFDTFNSLGVILLDLDGIILIGEEVRVHPDISGGFMIAFMEEFDVIRDV
jgi:hypothetical protein